MIKRDRCQLRTPALQLDGLVRCSLDQLRSLHAGRAKQTSGSPSRIFVSSSTIQPLDIWRLNRVWPLKARLPMAARLVASGYLQLAQPKICTAGKIQEECSIPFSCSRMTVVTLRGQLTNSAPLWRCAFFSNTQRKNYS